MSNSLDPEQFQLFVRPDLGPNCLQWLSADNSGRQKQVKKRLTICQIDDFEHDVLKISLQKNFL